MLRTLAVGCVTVCALVAATPASAVLLPGTHQIMSRQDPGFCLEVRDGDTFNGAPVGVGRCENAAHQRWTFDPTGRLHVEHTNKCLSVQFRGNGFGSQVVQDVCSEAAVWTDEDMGQGWSRLNTLGPTMTMCLDKAFSNVVTWSCHSGFWQQWQSLG